jgi:hypothetical protein
LIFDFFFEKKNKNLRIWLQNIGDDFERFASEHALVLLALDCEEKDFFLNRIQIRRNELDTLCEQCRELLLFLGSRAHSSMLSVVRRLFTTSSSSSGTGTTAASAAASAAAAASSSSTNTTTTQTSSTAFAFKRKSFKSSAHIEANLDAERARATIERGVVLNMIEPEPAHLSMTSDWPVVRVLLLC